MTEPAALLGAINGMRLMSIVLACAVLSWWASSWWRVVRGQSRAGDDARAVWVMLAVAVLLFQARWLWPGLAEADRLWLWLIAHAAMLGAMLAAIYIHGRREVEGFRVRRAAVLHLLMLIGCTILPALLR
jgi:hypothetical protein